MVRDTGVIVKHDCLKTGDLYLVVITTQNTAQHDTLYNM